MKNITPYNDFKKINESVKEDIIRKISDLKYFLVNGYGMNMRHIVDKINLEESIVKDYNPDYQYPLSLLFKTGKFEDIKFFNGMYYTNKLKNLSLVIDENGEWHPVNKLNTNYSDLADLLYDLFDKLGILNELPDSEKDLKDWLINFKNNNDIYHLIKQNVDDIKSYTKMNRAYSLIGEKAENRVASIIESKGVDILYRGGDGDFIDMIYGCDIISGKNDKIYLVQVKSSEAAAMMAFKDSLSGKNNYSKIDWFCSPLSDGVIIYSKGNKDGRFIN